ncbi:MAG TPA: DNA starvation/stationary phase protection protein [Armatimonadota bacterium]|jgi:starvation-inducible DNA-binding protein
MASRATAHKVKETTVRHPDGTMKMQMRALSTPPQLDTPTDLTADEREAIAAAVNPIIADAFALYVKTKNFHWHLASSRFRDLHLMFDEQAESVFEPIDVLAERLRKIGCTTMRSIGDIARTQTIPDDDDAFVPAEEMVSRLLADNRRMARAIRGAIELTEEKRDTPTSNLLQEVLDQTERRIWFLFEVGADAS